MLFLVELVELVCFCLSLQVRQQLRKTGCGAPWTGSVLARAEQERRLALLAREAVAQQVREGALGGEAAPSSGLPTLKAPQPWEEKEKTEKT